MAHVAAVATRYLASFQQLQLLTSCPHE